MHLRFLAVSLILLISEKCVSQEDTTMLSQNDKLVMFRLGGGMKGGESATRPTRLGYFIDLAVHFQIGEHWFLRLGYLAWESKSRFLMYEELITVWEYSAGAMFTRELSKVWIFSLSGLAGFGGASVRPGSESGRPATSSGLLSIGFEAGMTHVLSKRIHLTVFLRQQLAGSLSPGGGDAYRPILAGLGLQFLF